MCCLRQERRKGQVQDDSRPKEDPSQAAREAEVSKIRRGQCAIGQHSNERRTRPAGDPQSDQSDPRHASHLRRYEAARAAKTKLLSEVMPCDPAALGSFEEILVGAGALVAVGRRRALAALAGRLRHHAILLGSPFPEPTLRLRSDLPAEAEVDSLEAAFRAAIDGARSEERRRGRCVVGPHLDDVELVSGEVPLAARASSGESRTLVLAWTLAEVDVIREVAGEPPLIAFDDFDSEWDPGALDRFAAAIEDEGQLFLTSARPDAVLGLPLPSGSLLRVEEGRLRREGILGGGRTGSREGRREAAR